MLAGGVLFTGVGTPGALHALDPATGEVLWTYQTGDYINSTPAVINGWVYVGSFDHNLYAFHLPM